MKVYLVPNEPLSSLTITSHPNWEITIPNITMKIIYIIIMSLFILSSTVSIIASEEQRLELGLINAMKLINGQLERAGDSGEAIQAYIKKGYLNKKPNRRVDYTDYWLLKKPATFMGHTLIMIEEEYLLKYIGCCVNEGVGITLKISGSSANLKHFASENGCSFSEEIDIQHELKSLGIKSNFPKGNYVSLSCRVRDNDLSTEPSADTKMVYGKVITKDSPLNIRQSMGKNTKVVAKVPKDSKLRILETFGTWDKVQLDDGTIGYASSEYLQVPSEEDIIYGIVATKNSPLNVRKEMKKTSEVIAKIPKGANLRILNTFDSWYEVQLDNGIAGYASKEYVKLKNGLTEKTESRVSNKNDDVPNEPESESLQCGGKRYCSQMDSCAEARFYLNTCGLKKLDRDGDGIPCENVCR